MGRLYGSAVTVSASYSIVPTYLHVPQNLLRHKYVINISSLIGCDATNRIQTPLLRFVVDLLWTRNCCTTNPQHLDMSRCCGFVVGDRFVVDLLYNLLYNKSTTNRISGVWAITTLMLHIKAGTFIYIYLKVSTARMLAASMQCRRMVRALRSHSRC